MKKLFYIFIFSNLFTISCNEEFQDPTRPSEEKVFASREGIIGVANGLQSKYSLSALSPLYTSIIANGCTTNEIIFLNAGNANEIELQNGGSNVSSRNSYVTNIWGQCLVIKSESDKVIKNLNLITDPIEKASILAHASIFKSLVLLNLIQFYEKVPLTSDKNAVFSNRNTVLNEVINTLLATLPTINSANGFAGLVNTIKYKNTVNALLARSYLMIGDNQKALDYASLVDLTSKSTYFFDASTVNPIAFSAIIPAVGAIPLDRKFGLPTSLAPSLIDGRINFYLTAPAIPKLLGFYDTTLKLIPIYLPGEMTLIKAEAHARLFQLPQAIIELDNILTKTAAIDAFGIGANLSGYSGLNNQNAILVEIYRNRCIELYMSGLKLEDTKRFNRVAPVFPIPLNSNFEFNRNYYPYPESERFNNTNTPPDPAN